MNTKKYKNEFDNDTLTLYSGGGYIAKSRLSSTYSKRKRTAFGSKRSANYRSKRPSKRFNEELAETQSAGQRRAMSRGHSIRSGGLSNAYPRPMTGKHSQHVDKESMKNQIIHQIEKMDHEEIERMSKQIDEMTKHGDHENLENPHNEYNDDPQRNTALTEHDLERK